MEAMQIDQNDLKLFYNQIIDCWLSITLGSALRVLWTWMQAFTIKGFHREIANDNSIDSNHPTDGDEQM